MKKSHPPNRAESGPVYYHTGKFPPQDIDWSRLVPLIGPASAALARYDGLLAAIPNAAVLLSPLTMQEAVLSSRIEGTQATMGEVLEYEAGEEDVDQEKAKDIWEVAKTCFDVQYPAASGFIGHAIEIMAASLVCRT